MSKHKTVTKWVAVLWEPFDKEPSIKTAKWQFVETPKQYRIVGGPMRMLAPPESRDYRLALQACNYRNVINKGRNDCPLHDTEKAALVALHRHYVRQLDNARARVRRAEADEALVASHLEQKYDNPDESNSTG